MRLIFVMSHQWQKIFDVKFFLNYGIDRLHIWLHSAHMISCEDLTTALLIDAWAVKKGYFYYPAKYITLL